MTADWEDDLDRFMEGDLAAWSEDRVPVEVEGLEHADRLLRRLHRLDGDAATIDATYRERVALLDAWRSDRLSGVNSQRRWLDGSLEAFWRAYAEATGTASTRLPSGTLALRKAPDKTVVVLPVEAVAWLAADRPDWVKRTAEPRVADVKRGTKPGPPVSAAAAEHEGWPPAPDGYEYRRAVLATSDAWVAGIAYLVALDKTFSAKPAETEAGPDQGDTDG